MIPFSQKPGIWGGMYLSASAELLLRLYFYLGLPHIFWNLPEFSLEKYICYSLPLL